jgi:DNA polymerase-3 subunit epsilon
LARFVAVDVETAQSYDHVIEIGLVEIVGRRLTGREFSRRIKPRSAMSPFCLKVHGITLASLAREAYFEQVLPEIHDFVGDAPLVAHNMAYEYNTFEKELKRAKAAPWTRDRYVCSMAMARSRGHRAALRDACRDLGIGTSHLGKLHGALDDARMSAEIFVRLS